MNEDYLKLLLFDIEKLKDALSGIDMKLSARGKVNSLLQNIEDEAVVMTDYVNDLEEQFDDDQVEIEKLYDELASERERADDYEETLEFRNQRYIDEE